jgi:hypothetical protein
MFIKCIEKENSILRGRKSFTLEESDYYLIDFLQLVFLYKEKFLTDLVSIQMLKMENENNTLDLQNFGVIYSYAETI